MSKIIAMWARNKAQKTNTGYGCLWEESVSLLYTSYGVGAGYTISCPAESAVEPS